MAIQRIYRGWRARHRIGERVGNYMAAHHKPEGQVQKRKGLPRREGGSPRGGESSGRVVPSQLRPLAPSQLRGVEAMWTENLKNLVYLRMVRASPHAGLLQEKDMAVVCRAIATLERENQEHQRRPQAAALGETGAAGIEELGVLYNVLGSKYTLGGDLELAEAP